MIGKNMARWFIACACFAAVIGALGTIAFALSVGGLDAFNVGVAAVMLGLAYGIFRASRVSAILALVIYLAERMNLYSSAAAMQRVQGGEVLAGFWMSVLFFSALYLLGVIGTFAWPSDSAAPIQWKEPSRAKADERKPREKLAAAREFCTACEGKGKIPGSEVPCAWCGGAGFV
jgi:hypothetical protein